MEQRRLLDANPVVAGITYLEGDVGQDTTPDFFEVTFEGGSNTTHMTGFVISGDQDQSGDLSDGDVFFDVDSQAPGTGGFHPFQFLADQSVGVSAEDVAGVQVAPDGLALEVQLQNFQAGDKLAFSIDVDEVERFKLDKITSGVEYEGSLFSAGFQDDHYTFDRLNVDISAQLDSGFIQDQSGGIFYDEYDQLFVEGQSIAGTPLNLAGDNEFGQADRTAGAVDAHELQPKPVTLSGHVREDESLSCLHDGEPAGIEGVLISLQRWDQESERYETVAATRTDANGFYEFGTDLELAPGTFRLVEVQPDGYLDVDASPGTVQGAETGQVLEDVAGHKNIIAEIEVPLGGTAAENYDFTEVRPVSLQGNVFHDRNDDGQRDNGEEGIANVLIQVRRVRSITAESPDAFSDADPILVRTGNHGHYEVSALPPGFYQITEINRYPGEVSPLSGFMDGRDTLGIVNGQTSGTKINDQFNEIKLCAGHSGENYNFGELKPASISGQVWHDLNNDGLRQTEPPISNVTIQLLNARGDVLSETQTDGQGSYQFQQLRPGTYSVREIQPEGYVDGMDRLGEVDGDPQGELQNDQFVGIDLGSGQRGTRYDFAEFQLGSISGRVHEDEQGNCTFDPASGDRPLSGVILVLLDNDGQELARTQTDANGNYHFDDLLPGEYSVREIQPDGVIDGEAAVGTVGGVMTGRAISSNRIGNITLRSGDDGVRYDFCEHAPAEIHGRVFQDGPAFVTEDGQVPANYRAQRDGIFQANEDRPIAGARVQLYYYINPDNNSISPRPVTLSDIANTSHYSHLGAAESDAPVWVETDANGEYRFKGLAAGNYIVVQQQPDGFVDANDTAGSTSGLTFNSSTEAASAPQALVTTFSGEQIMDSVVNVRVNTGGASIENNFSEVVAERLPDDPTPPPPRIPDPPPRIPNPVPPSPPPSPGWRLAGALPLNNNNVIGSSRGAAIYVAQDGPYTWHLSVVNGGTPRSLDNDAQDATWLQATYLSAHDWSRYQMMDANWTFGETSDTWKVLSETGSEQFGMRGGIPLAGDFDGDAVDQMAVFKDGFWLIDINGNGTWDRDDLLVKLGSEKDQPVVGDWDGDGKEDIGIFGPMWEGDPKAIAAEPGLPDLQNRMGTPPKNVPPHVDEAAEGARVMKLTSHGKSRIDLIDHVFGYGRQTETPVTGDWNGDGVRSIGVFRDGHWQLDLNGDGVFGRDDEEFRFGRAGDIPLVGDFNGDGVEEVAIYRGGTWIVDANGNRQIDAADKVFEMGGASDTPVVGDWNGDGLDDPAIYQDDLRVDQSL